MLIGSAAVWLISTVFSGYLGNEGHKKVIDQISRVYERLTLGEMPINHHLQKAIRKSYILATLVCCEECLKSYGANISRQLFVLYDYNGTNFEKFGEDSENVRELINIHEYLTDNLRYLEDDDYIPRQTLLDSKEELFLIDSEKTEQNFFLNLSNEMIQELKQAEKELPERFISMMNDGWKNGELNQTWGNVLRAFFADILKNYDKVYNIFTSELLSNIKIEIKNEFYKVQECFNRVSEDTECIKGVLRNIERQTIFDEYAGSLSRDKIDKLVKEKNLFFVNRGLVHSELVSFICKNDRGIYGITGTAGSGKTSFMAGLVREFHDLGYYVSYYFFKEDDSDMKSSTNFYISLLMDLYIYYDLKGIPLPSDKSDDILRSAIYSIIKQNKANHIKPFILIIDGIDEAESYNKQVGIKKFIVDELPQNMYFVISARGNNTDVPLCLKDWTSECIYVPALNNDEIAEWVRNAGNRELMELSEDSEFIQGLLNKTKGLPLYMHFLVEDLIVAKEEGEDLNIILETSPQGFNQYINEFIRQIAQSQSSLGNVKIKNILALFCIILDSISEDEIEDITEGEFDKFNLNMLPQNVTRWFSIKVRNNKTYYSFTHPLIAQEVFKQLREPIKRLKYKLFDYCANWNENKSEYSLRNYVKHLYMDGNFEEVYKVIDNPLFAKFQKEVFPYEINLPLKNIEYGLISAIDTDNGYKIAKYLLRQMKKISFEDLVDHFNKESTLTSTEVLNVYDWRFEFVWSLLIACNLFISNKEKDGYTIMGKLALKKIEVLTAAEAVCSCIILTEIMKYDVANSIYILKGINEQNNIFELISEILISSGRIKEFETLWVEFGHKEIPKEILAMSILGYYKNRIRDIGLKTFIEEINQFTDTDLKIQLLIQLFHFYKIDNKEPILKKLEILMEISTNKTYRKSVNDLKTKHFNVSISGAPKLIYVDEVTNSNVVVNNLSIVEDEEITTYNLDKEKLFQLRSGKIPVTEFFNEVHMYEVWIELELKFGFLDRAEELLKDMPESGQRFEIIERVAFEYYKKGEFRKAIDICKLYTSKEKWFNTLANILADSFLQEKDYSKIMPGIQQIMYLYYFDDDNLQYSKTCFSISLKYLKNSETDKFYIFLDKGLERITAGEIRKNEAKIIVDFFDEVAKENISVAVDSTSRILDEQLKEECLKKVATNYCCKGDYSSAINAINNHNISYNEVLLVELANGCCYSRKLEDAKSICTLTESPISKVLIRSFILLTKLKDSGNPVLYDNEVKIIEEEIKLIEKNKYYSSYDLTYVYTYLAKIYIKMRNLKGFVDAINKTSYYRHSTLMEVMDDFIMNFSLEDALKMLQFYSKKQDVRYYLSAFKILICLKQLNREDDISSLYSLIMDEINENKNFIIYNNILGDLATLQIILGFEDEFWKTFSLMSTKLNENIKPVFSHLKQMFIESRVDDVICKDKYVSILKRICKAGNTLTSSSSYLLLEALLELYIDDFRTISELL